MCGVIDTSPARFLGCGAAGWTGLRVGVGWRALEGTAYGGQGRQRTRSREMDGGSHGRFDVFHCRSYSVVIPVAGLQDEAGRSVRVMVLFFLLVFERGVKTKLDYG